MQTEKHTSKQEISPKQEAGSDCHERLGRLLSALAERLVWVAPVGNDHSYMKLDKNDARQRIPALLGFMVCKRSVNNVDGKNTRVDFLRVDSSLPWRWKKPFRECECMFETMEAAMIAAADVEGISLANAERIHGDAATRIQTGALSPLPLPPCSDSSSLPLLKEECCISTSGKAEEGVTIGMLKERVAMIPASWDERYLTMQEIWNNEEYMRHLIPPERYQEKGTVCGLGFFAHGGGIKRGFLTVRILESSETDALLSSSQNTSPVDVPSDP